MKNRITQATIVQEKPWGVDETNIDVRSIGNGIEMMESYGEWERIADDDATVEVIRAAIRSSAEFVEVEDGDKIVLEPIDSITAGTPTSDQHQFMGVRYDRHGYAVLEGFSGKVAIGTTYRNDEDRNVVGAAIEIEPDEKGRRWLKIAKYGCSQFSSALGNSDRYVLLGSGRIIRSAKSAEKINQAHLPILRAKLKSVERAGTSVDQLQAGAEKIVEDGNCTYYVADGVVIVGNYEYDYGMSYTRTTITAEQVLAAYPA